MKYRPPAIMTKTQYVFSKLYNTMLLTIEDCMKRYKSLMNNYEFCFWKQLLIDIISDEIFGYMNRQYSRISSSSSANLVSLIKQEFKDFIQPICNKAVKRSYTQQQRLKIIAQNNAITKNNTEQVSSPTKVSFNLDKNIIYKI